MRFHLFGDVVEMIFSLSANAIVVVCFFRESFGHSLFGRFNLF